MYQRAHRAAMDSAPALRIELRLIVGRSIGGSIREAGFVVGELLPAAGLAQPELEKLIRFGGVQVVAVPAQEPAKEPALTG